MEEMNETYKKIQRLNRIIDALEIVRREVIELSTTDGIQFESCEKGELLGVYQEAYKALDQCNKQYMMEQHEYMSARFNW